MMQSSFKTENIHFKEIIKGSGLILSGKIMATGLGVISSLIIARYYGPDVMGIVAIINSVVAIVLIFGSMGMNTAILRLIPEYIEKYSIDDAWSVYKKVLYTVLLLSALYGVCVFLASPWIAISLFNLEILRSFFTIAAIFIPLMAVNSLNSETLRALQCKKRYALVQWLAALVNVTLLLLATFLFYHRYNPVYILFCVTAIMTPVLFWLVHSPFRLAKQGKPKITTREIFVLSFPMFLTSVMHLVIGRTDIIMLGAMTSAREVGVYNVALKLALLTSFILVSVNAMLAPKFSQLFHAGKLDELKMVARNCARLIFYATLPIIVIYLFFGNYILALFGKDFVSGRTALFFLIGGQFVNSAAGSVGYFLDMTGHQKVFQYIVMFGAVLNIMLNFLLIPHFGINGAAFASMISIATWNIMAAVAIKKRFGFFISYIPRLGGAH